MNSTDLNSLPPGRAIMTMRIICAALLLGQLFFLGVIAIILNQPAQVHNDLPAEARNTLILVNLLMLATIIPVMFFVRRTVYQRARKPDGTLPAGAYGTGNIIFWAGCEGISFFALIIILISHSFLPTLFISAAAMMLQAVTIPKASALALPENPYQNR